MGFLIDEAWIVAKFSLLLQTSLYFNMYVDIEILGYLPAYIRTISVDTLAE